MIALTIFAIWFALGGIGTVILLASRTYERGRG
jgi:hypothetical protein